MHYALPRLLHQVDALDRFYTDICADIAWPRLLTQVPRILLPGSLKRLAVRKVDGVPRTLITAFSAFGFLYQRRRSAARSSSEMTAIHLWAGERFCRLILESHPSALSDLYCFNSAGLELLSDWRARGRRGVVEQTIAPRRVEERLLREEEDAFPGWEAPRPRDAYVEAYMAREEAEWQAAHTIVCGSDFVKAGVAECGGPVERCVVVPYGVPLERFRPSPKPPLSGRKLRVLMVGEVGLRKGSHYVFAAAQRLADQIDFRLVGPISLLPRRVERVGDRVQLTGVVPRGEIIPHFDWADVFLLPSLCEGSATVTYEALSAGLPVIATPNTGSIVEHGKSGFIVPPRDMDALVAALERFLIEPGLLTRMRTAACERSHVGSLAAYGQRLMVVLAS